MQMKHSGLSETTNDSSENQNNSQKISGRFNEETTAFICYEIENELSTINYPFLASQAAKPSNQLSII
jgi:hypothetical protein